MMQKKSFDVIQLSDHFHYKRLLRFTFPSIIMLIFTSIYGVIDGFFVSNYVGKTPFTAVNFIMPVLMILGSVGFLFGIDFPDQGKGRYKESQRAFFYGGVYFHSHRRGLGSVWHFVS